MAAIEPHSARTPKTDPRWERGAYPRDELRRGLVHGGMAGVVSHPMGNVLWKIGLLGDGDPRSRFGLGGVSGLSRAQVLAWVARASGFEPDPNVRLGPVRVDPESILQACEAVGDRLAVACERGERVVLATGHPTGLIQLYSDVGRELAGRGVALLQSADGVSWSEGHRHREIRYVQSV